MRGFFSPIKYALFTGLFNYYCYSVRVTSAMMTAVQPSISQTVIRNRATRQVKPLYNRYKSITYNFYETSAKKVALYNGYTSKRFYFCRACRSRRVLQHGGVDNFFIDFYSYETKRQQSRKYIYLSRREPVTNVTGRKALKKYLLFRRLPCNSSHVRQTQCQ